LSVNFSLRAECLFAVAARATFVGGTEDFPLSARTANTCGASICRLRHFADTRGFGSTVAQVDGV